MLVVLHTFPILFLNITFHHTFMEAFELDNNISFEVKGFTKLDIAIQESVFINEKVFNDACGHALFLVWGR